jgi:hypothetical protein
MIPTTKVRPVLVRAEQEGFRPACALVENRRDTTLYLARSEPDARPFPSDAEVRDAWNKDRVNLCMARETTATEPAPVLVTAGDLSRPYEILGEVSLDTTGERSNVMSDVVLHGAILATLRPTPKGDAAVMLDDLRAAALAKYGAKVDAVINAKTETIGREVYARGVAVHFVDQWPAKSADAARGSTERSVTDRLRELDQLGASGAITPQEYRARRKAILDDL